MEEKTEVAIVAIIGAICTAQTFTSLAPQGPWENSSFTNGSIGLLGLYLLYRAWFRFTFNKKGFVPTHNLWKDPQQTCQTVIIVGLGVLLFAKGIGAGWLGDFWPRPTALLLTLIGLLIVMNGAYVALTVGVLSPNEKLNDIGQEE